MTRRTQKLRGIRPFSRQVATAIRVQLLKAGKEPLPLLQTGGGEVTIDGYRYDYRDTNGGYTVFGGRSKGKRPCFILLVDGETANLQSIETGKDCSKEWGCNLTPVDAGGASVQHTVRAAIAVAQQRGVKQLFLTDNATKHIGPGVSFPLSNMTFVTTGRTWYESFLPVRPVDAGTAVNQWREIVATLTWGSVWICLKKAIPELTVDIGDDVTDDTPACDVFRQLKGQKSTFFADTKHWLPPCCGIGSLYGLDWVMDLPIAKR